MPTPGAKRRRLAIFRRDTLGVKSIRDVLIEQGKRPAPGKYRVKSRKPTEPKQVIKERRWMPSGWVTQTEIAPSSGRPFGKGTSYIASTPRIKKHTKGSGRKDSRRSRSKGAGAVKGTMRAIVARTRKDKKGKPKRAKKKKKK